MSAPQASGHGGLEAGSRQPTAPTRERHGSTCTDHCITCSDEGTSMQIVSLSEDGAVCVDDGGSTHERIAVELVEPVAPGDRILVHAGVAIG